MEKEVNCFYTMYGIGKCRYTINIHTVGEYNRDGSPFYGIEIYSNKRKFGKAVSELLAKGYKQTR